MFNLVKALELALNDGKCMLSGVQMGAHTGTLADHATYEDVERAFAAQIDYFFDRMLACCDVVEKAHGKLLPSPFLRKHPSRRWRRPLPRWKPALQS